MYLSPPRSFSDILYLQSWDPRDFSLQNVLNALFMAMQSGAEHEQLVRDRVEMLASKIDDDNSGTLDSSEILAAVQALYGGGAEQAKEEAERLCGGAEGMPVADFVEAFTELAEQNLEKFNEVEKAYGIS